MTDGTSLSEEDVQLVDGALDSLNHFIHRQDVPPDISTLDEDLRDSRDNLKAFLRRHSDQPESIRLRADGSGARPASGEQSAGPAVSELDIARDQADYLRENPGVTAKGNVHGWRWVRHVDGEWRALKTGDTHRLPKYLEGAVLDEDSVIQWLTSKPVTCVPSATAGDYQFDPSAWAAADVQDVFTDHDRCWWCGGSERDHELTEYETRDHGRCLLCTDCVEPWLNGDHIVAEEPA